MQSEKDLIVESNDAFFQAWSFWTRARGHQVVEVDGIRAAWMNVDWPVGNMVFLADPVADEADLEARIQTGLRYAQKSDHAWLFVVCRNLIAEPVRDRLEQIFADRHFMPAAKMTGMVTENLAAPQRPLPELELRRVGDQESRRQVGELNCIANGMPLAWGHEAMDVAAMWEEPAFGAVGYLDGKAVSTATTLRLGGLRYVALVATPAEYQRCGYGEATMRYTLEEANRKDPVRRTLLHSSEAGRSLYTTMGYRPVADFAAFILS